MLVRNKLFIAMLFVFGNFCIAAENSAVSKDGKSEKNDRVAKIKRGALQGALLGVGYTSGSMLGCRDSYGVEEWNGVGRPVGGVIGIVSTRVIQRFADTTKALGFVIIESAMGVILQVVRLKSYCNEEKARRSLQPENCKLTEEQKYNEEKDEIVQAPVKGAIVGAAVGAVLINFLPASVLSIIGV